MAFPQGNGKSSTTKKPIKFYQKKEKKRAEYQEEFELIKKLREQLDCSASFDEFEQLPISSLTQKGLKRSKYTKLTDIQRESIILALKGNDILGAAKTGSGKTLAFVIPVLELLYREQWSRQFGLGALIITPTRELAFQIFEVFKKVGKSHDFTIGLVIGGKDLEYEKRVLNQYNIVIGTPGRLLHHMSQTGFCDNPTLRILVLDEADRILDLGFQEEMNAIIEYLPEPRQTLLFSATQTTSVKDLARLSLKDPSYVSVHENAKYATPESLIQSYLVCDVHEKMNFLWSFIAKHKKQKVLVFMATCKQVKYTFKAFCRLQPGISITALYGDMPQLKRMERYRNFCNKQHIVMFATDIAARGLDFPNVNWVLQLDCPEDVTTYIHRAGRTARYQEGGESVLVLLPSEKDSMVKQIEAKRIPISEIRCNPADLFSVTRKLQYVCADDNELLKAAQRAFGAYLKYVFFMKDKTVFDVRKINLEYYARSLGLLATPRARFISKQLKNQPKSENASADDSEVKSVEDKGNNELDTSVKDFETQAAVDIRVAKSWTAADSLSDDDDVFSIEKIIECIEEETEVPVTSKKVITKVAAAKKLLRSKVKLNSKIVFDEEGEVVGAVSNQGTPIETKPMKTNKFCLNEEEHQAYVEKHCCIKREMDKIDKEPYKTKVRQKHWEEKQKLKEKQKKKLGEAEELSEDVSEEEDTDSHKRRDSTERYVEELPDPDKYFGKVSENSDAENNMGSDAENDMEEPVTKKLPENIDRMSDSETEQSTQKQKRKKKLKESFNKRFKASKELPSTVAPALSLGGDEELALNLLQGL